MTKIIYFSGTGNTLWSAKKIAAQIRDQCELINAGVLADSVCGREGAGAVIEADVIILMFPAYAYGLPLVFSKILEKAELKSPYIAALVTFGTSPGGALAQAGRILRRKKTVIAYNGRIPAVENYTAIFGPQKPETVEKRLAMQEQATDEAARCINERRKNRVVAFRPFSVLVSMLFSIGIKVFYKWYRVNSSCDGCALCEKLCPVNAVIMKQGRPVFTKKCEHCQGCIHWCPKNAILFARIKSGTKRYHHPAINIADMTR